MNNIDLNEIKNFLMEFLPQAHHHEVQKMFELIHENPANIMTSGLMTIQMSHLENPDKPTSIAAFSGVLCGLLIGYCYQMHPEAMTVMFRDYIEQAKKRRGDNVVNFFHHKKG